MKKIVLFGATGSIGQSTLKIVRANPEQFEIVGASAHSNFEALESLGVPNILDTRALSPLRGSLPKGENEIEKFIEQCQPDMVLNAVTGFAGLKFTIETLEMGIPLALANKESLVVAGDLVMDLSRKHNAPIIPVDSEHSAIFQCLADRSPSWVKRESEASLRSIGGDTKILSPHPAGAPLNLKGANTEFKKILLTCSGGPFFGQKDLSTVAREQALKHPNWDMGAKITVDSATLANKCLEFFEAMHLFGATKDQIEIVIQRESIIHSMVEFPDSSIIAQISPPSMELPIAYALNFPERHNVKLPRVDFRNLQLNFAEPDPKTFRTLQVLEHCAEHMQNLPIVFNAANEEARNAFIDGKISFEQIFEILEQVVARTSLEPIESLEQIYEIDRAARQEAQSLL